MCIRDSKNADYGESERYLIFQHNEYTQKPILDDEGHMILRDEYYLDGLNCCLLYTSFVKRLDFGNYIFGNIDIDGKKNKAAGPNIGTCLLYTSRCV